MDRPIVRPASRLEINDGSFARQDDVRNEPAARWPLCSCGAVLPAGADEPAPMAKRPLAASGAGQTARAN